MASSSTNEGPRLSLEPTGAEPSTYARALGALIEGDVHFLVGGAVALEAYCGIHRNTKDLDVFVREADLRGALGALDGAGFRIESAFPHWLSKAHSGDHFIDVIFNSGNGAVPVDDEWFDHALSASVLGLPVGICPVEETIWSKSFVMERERFDGADVAHLLLARAKTLDWTRLLRRFGDHALVLFAQIVLFGYVFPDEAESIPRWVMDDLMDRAHGTPHAAKTRVCRGTMLSREQYLPDLARGWRDARLPPHGSMSSDAVALWTAAITQH